MNIVSILNKLKSANLVPATNDGVVFFSDCFNKFGISVLLLNDESKFDSVLQILVDNKLSIQKNNGAYNLKIFALAPHELEEIISEFSNLNELDFLRQYPELITEPISIKIIADNIRKYKESKIAYKDENGYFIDKLTTQNDQNVFVNLDNTNNLDEQNVYTYLQSILDDATLLDKINNNILNEEETDFNQTLEMQKVENKICEEYLFPVNDSWKIVINDKEVNDFQTIKNTMNLITKLNLVFTFHDALILTLFYKTELPLSDVKEMVEIVFKGGMN